MSFYGLAIKAKKNAVLDKVKANRAEHSKIVAEAREAYVEMAKKAVEKKLELLRKGKVVSLQINLSAPLDYTGAYDTAIRSLEMHTGDEIELSSEQVRCLIEDRWDWEHQFTTSNQRYSKSLQDKLANFDPED